MIRRWVKTHTELPAGWAKSETHDTLVIRNVATVRKSDMLCETFLTNFYFDICQILFLQKQESVIAIYNFHGIVAFTEECVYRRIQRNVFIVA